MTRESIVFLFKETFRAWREDNASRLAAALSYYTIFSLAPLLVIAIAVTGQIYAEGAREQIVAQASRYLGAQVADALGVIVENANQPSSGLIAGVIGVVTLLIGASGVFAQLMGAFDVVWKVQPLESRGILGLFKDRLLAFGMILVSGLLFLLTLIASAVIAKANDVASGFTPAPLNFAPLLNILVSFLLTTLLIAAIYKVLPRVTLHWRDVWIGAAATAALFVAGKELIGLYLGYANPSSGFGAAGSLIVLLVFVYYASQIFLLGAEFTKIYARRFGTQAIIEEDAMRYQIVMSDEPTMGAVAELLPHEEVQLTVRSLENVDDTVVEEQPRRLEQRSSRYEGGLPHLEERLPHIEQRAKAVETNGLPFGWILATTISFLIGIFVGGRRN